MAAARDSLATTLMLALEVGIDGIPQDWVDSSRLCGRISRAQPTPGRARRSGA